MCGILMFHGPSASERLKRSLNRLNHRGPDDDNIWSDGELALGFTRLAINDKGILGRQPHIHGDLIGAVNGEIYNHRELASTHKLAFQGASDTGVVLPLFERNGSQVIDELDGFYSSVIIRQTTTEVFCFRDHIGKKPLFVGRSGNELFITSELKTLDEIDWFKMLPKGATQVDLKTGKVIQMAKHQLQSPKMEIEELIKEAVRKRIPEVGQPVGLFLSGGLDSSIIAAQTLQCRKDVTYYTLASPSALDQAPAEIIIKHLGLRDLRRVPLPSATELPELLQKVVYATESYNPSIVSNGLATFLLAQAAHNDGIRVVLTGDGADELFGGYHNFTEKEAWRKTREHLLSDMQFTELRRIDTCSMAHGVEIRCPFLDRMIQAYSNKLRYNQMYDGDENKVTLRRQFKSTLPYEILHRKKVSFDVGSGIRKAVVRYLTRNGASESQELLTIWKELFNFDESNSHFHSYPEFDFAIKQRGEMHR